VLDAGVFALYLRGARIGEERFLIREAASGGTGPAVYRTGATLNLKVDGRTRRISVALETVGTDGRPRRYEAEFNGPAATSIKGELVRDRIRFDIRSPEGEVMKEFLLRGRVAIVERRIAHHHFFVWKLLAGRPKATATILVPSAGVAERVTIEDMGDEPVRIGEEELTLRHLRMTAESGRVHHIWMDGRRVMKVEVPEDEFVAIRTETEEGRAHGE
jgi:hypothetical protein